MKNTIREMKSKLERINRILKDTEQWISGLEDKSRGNYWSWTEKRRKGNEDSLRDLWDNIKHTNIHIIRILKGKEREKEIENVFDEIIVKNLPNLKKKTDNQVEKAQSPKQDDHK